MSPFQVYLLLQADRIVFTLLAIGIVSGTIGLICGAFGAAEDDHRASRFGKKSLALSSITWVLFLAMPSTSTIAAMVVLPKITSPQALEAMGKEGQELYGIVKDALRKLADEKPEEGRK